MRDSVQGLVCWLSSLHETEIRGSALFSERLLVVDLALINCLAPCREVGEHGRAERACNTNSGPQDRRKPLIHVCILPRLPITYRRFQMFRR